MSNTRCGSQLCTVVTWMDPRSEFNIFFSLLQQWNLHCHWRS